MNVEVGPVKVVHRLDVLTLAKVLHGATFEDMWPSVWQIRWTVKDRLAEHGRQGCLRLYNRAERDARYWSSTNPDDRSIQHHEAHLLWAVEQVRRAFRPRVATRRIQAGKPLIDVLTEGGASDV